MASIRMRKGFKAKQAILSVVSLALVFWVGEEILQAISDVLGFKDTGAADANFFHQAFRLLGMTDDGGTGILPVVAVIAVAAFILSFIEVSL